MEEDYRKVKTLDLSNRDNIGPVDRVHYKQSFDNMLIESIDEALADLLGRRSRDVIYDHLATEYRYGREDLPTKIHEFYEFLEKTFASGSKTIGRTVVRRLCGKLGYEFVHVPCLGFFDYLSDLKARSERDARERRLASEALSLGLTRIDYE